MGLKKMKQRFRLRHAWMINSIVLVFLVAVFCVTAFGFFVRNNYYTSVTQDLETKARTSASFFSAYVTKTYAEYYDSAYTYVASFSDASRVELQFLNLTGTVEISSSGITAGTTPCTPEIQETIATASVVSWIGTAPSTGEKILAVSAPMIYTNGRVVGVMRFVSSMALVDSEVRRETLVAAGIGLAAFLLVLFVNLIFLRTTLNPMQEVTRLARQIADGSYGIQMSTDYKDEIGEMAAAINDMSQKISQSERTQREFISSVSHELRTPLTAINGWAETLCSPGYLTGDAHQGVETILKESRRLTEMVEELLEFTRMQDGRFTLNVQQIDLAAELEDAIFTYRELLRQENIELNYTPQDEELPEISGDPSRLRQVFLNVLDNAAKYGADGKRIDVSIETDGKFIDVIVRDYGTGVDEAELPLLKQKFFKGSNAQGRGSGIGLAVCDEILRFHGGELLLTNAEEQGLKVTIRLPVSLGN